MKSMNVAGISEKELSNAQQELGWIHLFLQCVLGNSAAMAFSAKLIMALRVIWLN